MLVRALIVAVLASAGLSVPASAAVDSLEDAVTSAMREVSTTGEPRVTATREDARWAFGTAVLVSADHPVGWLFAAEKDNGRWRVALEGRAGFADLTARSPLTGSHERTVLGAQAAGGDYRTGMALPFAVGQTWTFNGGPHGWAGSDRPYSAMDLSGGDQRVLAVRAGNAYTMCRGWIRVLHDRGYATDYYHLWNNISANGTPVAQGTRLGDTGTDVTCGGSANGRHVHFALRQNDTYVALAGHHLGGWVFREGASAYQGSALHGSTAVGVGGGLRNHGALGFNQGVVDAFGGGTVNRRTGPGTGYALAGSSADGATVTISCSANGTTHTGRWGTTSLWNRLTDGTWVSDAYLWTGLSGPVNGYC